MNRFFDILIGLLLLVMLWAWGFVLYDQSQSESVDGEEIVQRELYEKIFSLYVYSENPFSDNEEYIITQMGSAVLIDKNTIITNAHVVLDDNNEPTWLYEVCQTYDTKENPVCTSHATLEYYDRARDLALLTIPDDVSWFDDPVEFGSGDVNLWDTVTVYGYPANGGNTITLTQWKISWYESQKYKIDASIDSGNSWGWAFDDKKRLVWIPSFVIEWLSTLWYMVSIDTLREFLDKQWTITQYDNPVSPTFISRIDDLVDDGLWTKDFIETADREYDLFLGTPNKKDRTYLYTTADGNSTMNISRMKMYRFLSAEQFVTSVADLYENNCLTSSRFSDTLGGKDFEVLDCEESTIVPDTRMITYISLSQPGIVFEIVTQPWFDISSLKDIIAQTTIKDGTIVDGGTKREQRVVSWEVPVWLNITHTLWQDWAPERIFLMEWWNVWYSLFQVIPNKGFEKASLADITEAVWLLWDDIPEEYLQIKKTDKGREYIKLQIDYAGTQQDLYILVTTIPNTKNIAIMTFAFDYQTTSAARTFQIFIDWLELEGESPFWG